MSNTVLRGTIKVLGPLPDGTGQKFMTVNPTTGEVGQVDSPVSTVTGDISIDGSGVSSINAGVIVNADINASAAIAHTKMAALAVSRVMVTDSSGFATTGFTVAVLNFSATLTSDAQAQINGKQSTIIGAASTIVSLNLNPNKAVVSGATGKIEEHLTTTLTEIGYSTGVTSPIQTQLNARLSVTLTGAAEGDIIMFNGSNWVNLARGTNGQFLSSTASTIQWASLSAVGVPVGGTTGQALTKINGTDYNTQWTTLTLSSLGVSASAAEVDLLIGAGANIQTQLNGKLSSALATNNLWVGVAGVATPTTDIPTGTTIGGAVIYRVAGTDVTLADGGTGASLVDPNADRIFFWDDSAGSTAFLTPISGLNITTTNLSLGGALTANTDITGAFTLQLGTSGSRLSNLRINATSEIDLSSNSTIGISATTAVGISTEGQILIETTGVTGSDYIQFRSGGNNRLFINSNGSWDIAASTGTSGQVLTSAGSGATPTWQTPGTGITNGAAANELMKSDGTNAVASGLFTATNGNITLGSASIAGNRAISAINSGGNASLTLTAENGIYLSNDLVAVLIEGTNDRLFFNPENGFHIGSERKTASGEATFNILASTGISGSTTGQNILLQAGGGFASGNTNGGNIHLNTGPKNGSGLDGNIGFFTTSGSFGSGEKVTFINNATTSPTSNPTNGFILYSEDLSASAKPKIRDEAGNNGFIPIVLYGSATLDFPNTAASTSSDLTMTVTGASVGDAVALGIPNGSIVANSTWSYWVSAADTVTVRFSNLDILAAGNPVSGTFKAIVFKNS